mgnify:CR=1 FL=1
MFNRIRNGEYEVFEPVPIKEYFLRDDAVKEDIECYLSFRNVELTCRGTLEVRSDCAQKKGRFFTPPAFNLGILHNMEKAEKALDDFFKNCNIDKPNSELRQLVNECREEEIAPKYILDELCGVMLEIAREGLVSRGKGEEILI